MGCLCFIKWRAKGIILFIFNDLLQLIVAVVVFSVVVVTAVKTSMIEESGSVNVVVDVGEWRAFSHRRQKRRRRRSGSMTFRDH